MTGGRVAFKFAVRYLVTPRVKSDVGVLAKAVADRTGARVISGRELNSAAVARGNLTYGESPQLQLI